MGDPFDPTHRPGLVYWHAFDWLATSLVAIDGPAACLASTSFHGAELLRRLPGTAFLPPLPGGLSETAQALGVKQILPAEPKAGAFAAVAWLEPTVNDLDYLPTVRELLHSRGKLFLITGGYLGRFLAERRLGIDQADNANIRQVRRMLDKHGFRIEKWLGWHGLRAISWHLLSQICARFGHLDWRDRCHYAMRRAFVEYGVGRRLVALNGLVATPVI